RARVGAQARDGLAPDEVLLDDLDHVLGLDVGVPHGLGIDDDADAVLARVEAAGRVRPDLALEPALVELALEDLEHVLGAARRAAAARIARVALVGADEDVVREPAHEAFLSPEILHRRAVVPWTAAGVRFPREVRARATALAAVVGERGLQRGHEDPP